MTNLTPEHLRCPAGDCPSVHELPDGRLLIVGEVAKVKALLHGIPVGKGERAIAIDPALLANVLNSLEHERTNA